jgi:hypothetical protein
LFPFFNASEADFPEMRVLLPASYFSGILLVHLLFVFFVVQFFSFNFTCRQ